MRCSEPLAEPGLRLDRGFSYPGDTGFRRASLEQRRWLLVPTIFTPRRETYRPCPVVLLTAASRCAALMK